MMNWYTLKGNHSDQKVFASLFYSWRLELASKWALRPESICLPSQKWLLMKRRICSTCPSPLGTAPHPWESNHLRMYSCTWEANSFLLEQSPTEQWGKHFQLTFTNLWAFSADDKLMIFFLFFPVNRIQHFMQIVSWGDNLHEMSNPVFWEK